MNHDELYLKLSQILFSFVATEVVKRCINNPTMTEKHYVDIINTLPPLSVPFPPHSTWGLIVDRMAEMIEEDDDINEVGNIILKDHTVAPAIMGEELIQSLTNLAQNTRGYLSSVIYEKAQDICEKITSILSKTSLFNLDEHQQVLPMRKTEMVEWDILDHPDFVNSLVNLGESLINQDLTPYNVNQITLINRMITPPNIIGMNEQDTQHINTMLKDDVLGEESPTTLQLLTSDIGIWKIISDYKQSIYNASRIFDILDELTVAHALLSKALTHSTIQEQLSDAGKTFLEDNLKRVNLALLGIHIARKTIYDDIYFLFEGEDCTIYVNRDNYESAIEDDLSAEDIGDIVDYRHKRGITIPPQGLNLAALQHERARAIASKIQTQAELATQTDKDAKGLYLNTAKTTLISSLGKFIKENQFKVDLADLNRLADQTVWKMDANPDFPMKMVMDALVNVTPHKPLKIMMKYLEDVPRMTSLREDVAAPMIAHFVRGILTDVI